MYAAAFETLNLEADRVMSAPVDSEADAAVLNACGLSLDLSRQWLDEGARAALQALVDEVGDLPLDAQVKLLRVLQSGEVCPIGGRPRDVDVRIENDPVRWSTGYDFQAVTDGKVIKETIAQRSPAATTGFAFNTRRDFCSSSTSWW